MTTHEVKLDNGRVVLLQMNDEGMIIETFKENEQTGLTLVRWEKLYENTEGGHG